MVNCLDSKERIKDDDYLWRYMDLDKFLYIMQYKLLYCPTLDKFTDDIYENYCDIFELLLPGSYNLSETIDKKYEYYYSEESKKGNDIDFFQEENKRGSLAELFVRACQGTIVSCWHKNNNQSAAMWNLYSTNNRTAIAIKTNGRALKKFAKNNGFKIGEVTYIDYKEKTPDLYNAIWYKRKVYKHEEEVRLVKTIPNYGKKQLCDDGIHYKHSGGTTCVIPFDIDYYVDAIYISPYASSEYEQLIKSVMDHYGIKNKVVINNQKLRQSGYVTGSPLVLAKEICKDKER